MKNIKPKAPNKKLNSKQKNPFKILKKIRKINFKLDLPKIIRQYPVFHISLFSKNPADPLSKQAHPKLKLVKINNDDEKYKMDDIIDIKIIKKIIKAQIK